MEALNSIGWIAVRAELGHWSDLASLASASASASAPASATATAGGGGGGGGRGEGRWRAAASGVRLLDLHGGVRELPYADARPSLFVAHPSALRVGGAPFGPTSEALHALHQVRRVYCVLHARCQSFVIDSIAQASARSVEREREHAGVRGSHP